MLAAFLTSLICMILAKIKNKKLSETTCRWLNGSIPDYNFLCTQEIAACNVITKITLTNWADNRMLCRETRASRQLLYAFVPVSLVLVGLYAVKVLLSRKNKQDGLSADERVSRLQSE